MILKELNGFDKIDDYSSYDIVHAAIIRVYKIISGAKPLASNCGRSLPVASLLELKRQLISVNDMYKDKMKEMSSFSDDLECEDDCISDSYINVIDVRKNDKNEKNEIY